MTDRVPGAPGRCTGLVTGEELQKLQSGEPFAITLRRDDQPVKEGTPYSKAAVLPDALAAVLCPEVDDPAPKDAFAALHQKKADTIQQKTGAFIVASNSACAPVQGLRLFGTENGSNSNSICITAVGKNLFQGKLLGGIFASGSFTLGPENALVYKSVKIHLFPGTYTVSFGKKVNIVRALIDGAYEIVNYLVGVTEYTFTVATAGYAGFSFRDHISSTTQWSDSTTVQIESGSTATKYEPYAGQTLTVSVPEGLKRDGLVCDEIDFAKGVYICRVGVEVPTEKRLSVGELSDYAALHTYAPTTCIFNSIGGEMQLRYVTPVTAVKMVHNPSDAGKYLSVDGYGCVYPAEVTVRAADVQYLNETIAAQFVILQENIMRVIHQEETNGWLCRIWSNNFIELYKKDMQTRSITENGAIQVTYDLPFGLSGDPVVNVTACGRVFMRDIVKVDNFTLALIFEGEPEDTVSSINLRVTGFVTDQ